MPDDEPTGDRLHPAGGGGAKIRLTSGVLVLFFAIGFASWFSGAASWAGFYLGARGPVLTGLAQATMVLGFVLGVAGALAWYWRRCRRGDADISPRAAATACLVLPLGNVFWAIFVDAIAYHYGEDLVRPAFDYAIMYLVLGGLLPVTLGTPWLVSWLRRVYADSPAASPA